MALTLSTISPHNHEQARRLSVLPHQEKFVGSIEKSLADAYVWSDSLLRIACEGENTVGFILVFPFEDEGLKIVSIVRLMIDKDDQGRGLGRELLVATLEWIRSFDPVVDEVRISTLPSNTVALNLYRSMGFSDREFVDEEQVLSLKIGER